MSNGQPQAPPVTRMLRDLFEILDPRLWTDLPDQPDLPRGDGHAVLFSPGILAGDFTTASTRGFIARLGYASHGWALGPNWGPTRRIVRGLERRLFDLNESSGRRVSLVGRSLGGLYFRELAKRHPERVRRLFLVCSPTHVPTASLVSLVLSALSRFYDPSFPRSPEALNPPTQVPTTAFYTRRDGFLAWQHCLDSGPLAENVEIDAGHCAAGRHPRTLRILAMRLAEPDRA